MSNLKRVHIKIYKDDYEHLLNTLPDRSFSKFVRTLLHKYVKKNKVDAAAEIMAELDTQEDN